MAIVPAQIVFKFSSKAFNVRTNAVISNFVFRPSSGHWTLIQALQELYSHTRIEGNMLWKQEACICPLQIPNLIHPAYSVRTIAVLITLFSMIVAWIQLSDPSKLFTCHLASFHDGLASFISLQIDPHYSLQKIETHSNLNSGIRKHPNSGYVFGSRKDTHSFAEAALVLIMWFHV